MQVADPLEQRITRSADGAAAQLKGEAKLCK